MAVYKGVALNQNQLMLVLINEKLKPFCIHEEQS